MTCPPQPGSPVEIPSRAPVMVLPECNLLPHGLLPLFIFEPRYRQMLRDALATDRYFCVGMPKKADQECADPQKDVFSHSTVGMIRASVRHDDGTSHLVLQGIRRVRFLDWFADRPYREAAIEPLESTVANPLQAEALAEKLVELAQELIERGVAVSSQLKRCLTSIHDPDIIADIVGYNFISNPYTRQYLIETAELCERLRYTLDHLARGLERMQTGSGN